MQASRPRREIELRRDGPAPQHELVHAQIARGEPPAHRRGALRETEHHDARRRAGERVAKLDRQQLEIRHVVGDLGGAVFARHPARTNAR
jgi:hypothetical protein